MPRLFFRAGHNAKLDVEDAGSGLAGPVGAIALASVGGQNLVRGVTWVAGRWAALSESSAYDMSASSAIRAIPAPTCLRKRSTAAVSSMESAMSGGMRAGLSGTRSAHALMPG
jgi:hypothetical protein